jgi:hypothetical protein
MPGSTSSLTKCREGEILSAWNVLCGQIIFGMQSKTSIFSNKITAFWSHVQTASIAGEPTICGAPVQHAKVSSCNAAVGGSASVCSLPGWQECSHQDQDCCSSGGGEMHRDERRAEPDEP